MQSIQDIAFVIERFLDGTANPWAWDDFISTPLRDPTLDRIRLRCATVASEFPSQRPTEYCNQQGVEQLWQLVRELRASGA